MQQKDCMTILVWNCCGIERRCFTSRLHHLLEVHISDVVLGESKLTQQMITIALKGFNLCHLIFTNPEGSCGGITLFATTNKPFIDICSSNTTRWSGVIEYH